MKTLQQNDYGEQPEKPDDTDSDEEWQTDLSTAGAPSITAGGDVEPSGTAGNASAGGARQGSR